MNLSNAMGFPFKRPGAWGKIAIGGVLVLIPFIGWFFISGYMIEVLRRVIAGEADPLPEWDDFGTKFKRGALAFVLILIWGLPIYLIIMIPSFLLMYILDNTGQLMSMMSFPLGLLIGIVSNFFTPAFLGRYAVSDDFKEGLRFREIFSMIGRKFSAYIGNWLLAGVLELVAAVILWSIGAVACGIGYIFTQFYWCLFIAHITGQLYLILMQDNVIPSNDSGS